LKINSAYCFIIYVVVTIIVVLPMKIYAYLDPGSGSYILQVLLGTLLGGSYLIKVYWEKIKSFFSRKPSNKSPESGDEDK